uniref:Uncharacterized protein n=1 Tax=viral metagenome TaxID=1070528 RepID=A0A6C0L3Q1_9ZZZZ|tara:strand:- start:368 stop:982 length:615 start_codon:yes stop_codon:yes gene_type:complete
MTELVKARDFAMDTLERVKRVISAKKILRTWCLFKERETALNNKVENSIVVDSEWRNIPEKDTGKNRVSFNVFSKTQSHNGSIVHEVINTCDGVDKDLGIFGSVVFSWIKAHDKSESFFTKEGKKWMENTEKWIPILEDTIDTLDENRTIILWINRDNRVCLTPYIHTELINKLMDTWSLHLRIKDIMERFNYYNDGERYEIIN